MSDLEYTYAVARVRGLEVSLFSQSTIDQLMACKSYESAINMVVDKGWGGMDVPVEEEAILAAERRKLWATVAELRVPMETFDVLSYPNVYHNLKTAIKETYLGQRHDEFYYDNTTPSRDELRDIVDKKEFARLPGNMSAPAKDAYETLAHTGDGQLCDVIIDAACMDGISKAGDKAQADIIKEYAKTIVAITNIKIAVRCARTGKSMEFMQKAMTSSGGIDKDRLARAALSGVDGLCDFLASSGYAEAAESIKESPSAFERWCDNHLIEMIRPQKYKAFGIGPIVAYVLARENEIRTVGIILSGKANGLSDDSIRERVRTMYV